MNAEITIHCHCDSWFSIKNELSHDSLICPNCGKPVPSSESIETVLASIKEIHPANGYFLESTAKSD